MKAETLQKRLDNRYKGSKAAKEYQIVKDLINGTNKTYMVHNSTIRPVKTTGRGLFTHNLDYTSYTERLLKLLSLKFKRGNDAPRGGLSGNYIVVLTKIERENDTKNKI